MQATIVNFRSSRHRQKPNQMILKIDSIDAREKAKGLVGKDVVWKSPAGKELHGKIRAPHGNKGCVRVLFDTGMPGQALGKKVEIKN